MIDLSNSTINELIMSVGIMTGVIAFFFFTVAYIFSQLSQELITNIGGDYLLPVIAIYSGMLIGLKVFSNIAVDFF